MPRDQAASDPFFMKSTPGEKRSNRGSFFKSKDRPLKARQNDGNEENRNNPKRFQGTPDKPRGFFKPKFDKNAGDDKFHKVKQGRVEKGANSKDAKPFDKKIYRMKRYSNKYKLEKWENQRRKDVLKSYYKDLKNDPMAGKYKPFNFDEADNISDDSNDETEENNVTKEESTETKKIHYVLNPDRLEKMKERFKHKEKPKEEKLDKKGKIQPFWKVKQEMQRLKEEKKANKEAMQKATEERKEALVKYKKNKAEKFKKLSKKTKTGQPLMRDRMQMLLETIQKTS